MNAKRLAGAAIVLVALGTPANSADPAASAASEQSLPTYKVLPCPNACARATPAVPVDIPKPLFPLNDVNWLTGYVEGLVQIRYTIAVDGHVSDAAIERLLGPPDFGERALDSVRRRVFRPATVEGKPVEQGATVRFVFRITDSERGAREKIARAYQRARDQLRDGKADEALAILGEASKEPHLNFYERTMMAYVMALVRATRKEYDAALSSVDLALLNDGDFLDRKVRESALRLGFDLLAVRGDFAKAFHYEQVLKDLGRLKADDPILATAAKMQAAIDATTPLGIPGYIPRGGDGESNTWRHVLLRRTFAFDQIAGTVGSFMLSCDQQAIESPVKMGAEWHVPPTWSNCDLLVEGDPGATFRLIEYK